MSASLRSARSEDAGSATLTCRVAPDALDHVFGGMRLPGHPRTRLTL